MNTVIFVRGNNITGQIEQCREYAEKRGYIVEGVIVGQGRNLPEIIKGLDKKINLVLLSNMSRLSRNALENYTVQTELEIDYGVLIEVADDDKRIAAEQNLMKNIVKAVYEEQQRERKRKERIFELKLRGIIE